MLLKKYEVSLNPALFPCNEFFPEDIREHRSLWARDIFHHERRRYLPPVAVHDETTSASTPRQSASFSLSLRIYVLTSAHNFRIRTCTLKILR